MATWQGGCAGALYWTIHDDHSETFPVGPTDVGFFTSEDATVTGGQEATRRCPMSRRMAGTYSLSSKTSTPCFWRSPLMKSTYFKPDRWRVM